MANAKESDHPSDEQAERDARKRRRVDAQMLAALHSADEEELDRFRRQRLGRDSEVTHEDMVRAREILDVLVEALRDDADERWRMIERAWAEMTAEMTAETSPDGFTEQPPDSVTGLNVDVELDDGDRPTTPPAPPAASRPSWPGREDNLSDSGETPPHPRVPTPLGNTTPTHGQPAWPQPPAPTAAQVPQAPPQAPAPQGPPAWGQAYAPGSLPAGQGPLTPPMQAAVHPPVHPQVPHPHAVNPAVSAPPPMHPGQPPMAPTHGTHPMTNQPPQVAAYAQQRAQPQGPPSSQSPFQQSGEAREPTPPLFTTQRVDPTTAPAPVSARTPVHTELDLPPPSERTDPHMLGKMFPKGDKPFDPTETVAMSAAQKRMSRTAELSFASSSHAFALTVEEYATLCAQRDLEPDNAHRIERRYDIPDDRVRDAVDRAFELRFEADEALEEAFKEAYARSKALLVVPEDETATT